MIDYLKSHGDGLKKPPKKKTPLEKYLIIVDDLIGAKEFNNFNSDLANFCLRSRHLNITFIWSS